MAHTVHQQLVDQDFAAAPGIGIRAHVLFLLIRATLRLAWPG
jgi:hypothetical protein